MGRLSFTLGVIALGLAVGWTIQRLAAAGRLGLPLPLPELRQRLQKIGLLGCMYFSFMATVWIVRLDDLRLAALPAVGVAVLVGGGLFALAAARLFRLDRRQTGAYFACGSFSNIGSIGALVVYVFLGEEAFAYVPLYKLFEEIYYFTVGFPIAKYFSAGAGHTAADTAAARLKAVFRDVFVLGALAAIGIGGGLNLAGIPRPEIFGTLNAVAIPLGTFILLASIGMAMRFSRLGRFARECAAVAGIKFLILPALAGAAGVLLGFGEAGGGLPLRVTVILAAMPVAFTALIPPSIYDLDLDLANACWLTSTLALAFVLPVLYGLVHV